MPDEPGVKKVAAAGESPAANRTREAALEEEVRELKDMVQELSKRVEQLSSDGAARAMPPAPPSTDLEGIPDIVPLPEGGLGGTTGPQDASSAEGGSAAARGPLESRRTTRFNMPGVSPSFPTYGVFGPGFQLQSKDEEFQLQVHDLTQVDGRFYTQGQQVPVMSTFLVPRQWLIFSALPGHLSITSRLPRELTI